MSTATHILRHATQLSQEHKQPDELLDAARSYAARGVPVHPLYAILATDDGHRCACYLGAECPHPGKHPRTLHGFHDATTDAERIARWWAMWPGSNLGMPTGALSGIDAYDYDAALDADGAGLSGLVDGFGFPLKAGQPAPMPTVRTRRGYHFYARHTPGLRCSASLLAPHVDVRADGGYVVLPPSRTADGGRYAWRTGLDAPVFDVPPERLAELLRDSAGPSCGPVPDGPPVGDGRYWLALALARAVVGNRNDVGFALARQLRDDRLPTADARLLMLEYAAGVPQEPHNEYTEAEALSSLDSAYARPPRMPACRTADGGVTPVSLSLSSSLLTMRESHPISVPCTEIGWSSLREDREEDRYTYLSRTTGHSWAGDSRPPRAYYFSLADAADALPRDGKKQYAGSPAHRRRHAQADVFTAAWSAHVPGACVSRAEVSKLWKLAEPGRECRTLVVFFFDWLSRVNLTNIKTPRAYFIRSWRAHEQP